MLLRKWGSHVRSDWNSCECTGTGATALTLPRKGCLPGRSCKFKVSIAKFLSQCKAAEVGTSWRTVAHSLTPFLSSFDVWKSCLFDCLPNYYYCNHGYWEDKLCTLSLNYCLCHGRTWHWIVSLKSYWYRWCKLLQEDRGRKKFHGGSGLGCSWLRRRVK